MLRRGPVAGRSGGVCGAARRVLAANGHPYGRAYGDVAVECDFQAGNAATGAGDAGIILRAQVTTPEAHDRARCGALPARQDASHHYWVHTPWVGQTTRAKHFWLAISKMDASGWARNLALQVVPGVPAETHRWYRLRVEAQGPHIRTWVDGVPGPAVTDDTYGAGDTAGDTPGLHNPNGTKVVQTWRSGCVGMAGYGEFRCKELRVAADQAALPLDWSPDPPQIAWFALLPDFRGVTDRQKPHSLRRLPGGPNSGGTRKREQANGAGVWAGQDGTLVLTFDDRERNYTTRSHDGGATWDEPLVLPADRVGALHVTREGRLWACNFVEGAFRRSESTDAGRTWGPVEEYPLTEPWPDDPLLGPNFYGQGIYEAPDGTLVVFLHGSLAESHEHDLFTWGSYKAQVYSIRSTDGGKTWSAPVNVDGVRKQDGKRGVLPGCLDLIEPVASFTADGRLLAYCRPIYSPTMWQATSTDAAQTWDAVAIGPFPGYSAGMICTSSGALLVAHRFPNTTIHTSLDGGRSWDAGTCVDWPVWASGKFVEVAPDVVLFVYRDDHIRFMRGQFIRITEHGLEPLPRDWRPEEG